MISLRHLKFKKGKQLLVLILLLLFCLTLLAYAKKFLLKRDHEPNIALLRDTSSNITNKCGERKDWNRCYGEELSKYNSKKHIKATLNLVSLIQEADSKTRDCHLIAHKIAGSEIAKDPRNWSSIFKHINNQTLCNGGYVHGIMEGRSRFDPKFELNAEVIDQTCRKVSELTRNKNTDPCAHVLGHISLAEKGGDINDTVGECSKLRSPLKTSCMEGLFMENVLRENLADHGILERLSLDEENIPQLEQICEQVNHQAVPSCWRELSHIYVKAFQYDPVRVFKSCYRAPDKETRKECYLHGVNLMVVRPGLSKGQLAVLCSPYYDNTKSFASCKTRVINSLLQSSSKFSDRVEQFCSVLPEAYQVGCFLQMKLKKVFLTQGNACALISNKTLCELLPNLQMIFLSFVIKFPLS